MASRTRASPIRRQLEAYFTVARKDPSLWPYWFRKLDKLSKSAPDDPAVLSSLGAVALAEKKDNAKAADYFSRALKQGSEEPITFLNLATALGNMGRTEEAQVILERGVAAYPYSDRWWLGWRCSTRRTGQRWRAQSLIQEYRKIFPENPEVRQALQQIDALSSAGETMRDRGASVAPPR